MEYKYIVYVHINKANGKRYVGVTSKEDPNIRWQDGRGYKENPHFNYAIQKYGWDKFAHIILYKDLPKNIAFDMEQTLIKMWNTQNDEYGYNLTADGEGSPGYRHTEEAKKKMSEARKRENLSEETLRRRSEGLKGRKFSESHKKKIGEGNSKPINMLTVAGDFIRSFASAREVEVKLNINHSHISQCCHNKRKTAGGYCWEFAQ